MESSTYNLPFDMNFLPSIILQLPSLMTYYVSLHFNTISEKNKQTNIKHFFKSQINKGQHIGNNPKMMDTFGYLHTKILNLCTKMVMKIQLL